MGVGSNQKIIWVLCLLFCFFFSCNKEEERHTYIRLQQWDNQLEQDPETILDSLEMLDPKQLSSANNAYYGLLKTIADDKTYAEFTSDSLIGEVVRYYHRYLPETNNHIRSLIYQSVVRYRMGISDSTVLIPLKEAGKIFYALSDKNNSIAYLLNFFLGSIHTRNSNFPIAKEYQQKALQYAKIEKNPTHIFDSYLSLFWNSMKLENFELGKAYLDTINTIFPRNADESYYLLNAQSVYYLTQDLYYKALEKEKEKVQLVEFMKQKPDIFRIYYSISGQYHNLGQLDSAMCYALKSIDHISDPDYALNYLLYENVAEIAQEQQDFKTANDYRREAAYLHEKTIVKERDVHIFELEKRYNLSESENKTLRAEATTRVAIIVILCLIVLLTFSAIYIQKRKNKAKLDKMEMEKERRRNKQQQFILKLYQQLLSQFFSVEKELSNLANKVRKAKPDFADFIEELRKTMAKNLIEGFAEDLSEQKFEELTGISLPDGINKSELLMFFLIYCGIDNSDMSVVFKASKESIRTRKSQLKNKLKELGVDVSFFDQGKSFPL